MSVPTTWNRDRAHRSRIRQSLAIQSARTRILIRPSREKRLLRPSSYKVHPQGGRTVNGVFHVDGIERGIRFSVDTLQNGRRLQIRRMGDRAAVACTRKPLTFRRIPSKLELRCSCERIISY